MDRGTNGVERIVRGYALDMLELVREADEVDTVTVIASDKGGEPHVMYMGLRGGKCSFTYDSHGEDVPDE